MHKSQVFLYFLLAFIAGVSVGSFLFLGQILTIILFTIGSFGVILFWRRHWLLVVASFALIFFVFGVWQIEAARLNQGILSQFASVNSSGTDKTAKIKIELLGYVVSEPQLGDTTQKLTLAVKQYTFPGVSNAADEKVLVTTDSVEYYEYGQKLKVSGFLEMPSFQAGEFDYKTYLAKDGIYTTMFASKIELSTSGQVLGKPVDFELSEIEHFKIAIFSRIFGVKKLFERSVDRSMPEPNASYINGILLGSKAQIPQDIKDAFARTSTSHILAISGYNITIVAQVISWLLLLFLRRQKAFWFSLAAITVFTIMTGAQSAVVRAAIMGMLILLARREGRFYNVQNAIIFAAAVMIYLNPMILRYDVGFQLSFAATLGIVFLSPKLEKQFQKLPNMFKLRETLVVSLSAQIFVLPLILYYFKSLSLVSIPANLLVLPTIPYAMLLGFATGIIGMFWPFCAQLIGYLTWLLSSIEIGIIRLLAAPSWAALNFSFHWIMVALAYLGLAGYIYHDRKKATNLTP